MPFCIPSRKEGELLLPHTLASVWGCQCCRFWPSWCVLISHCFIITLMCSFLIDVCWTSFHLYFFPVYLIFHLYIFFGEVSIQIFCLFFVLFLFLPSFKSSLYIWITVLYQIRLPQIFPPGLWPACLLVLWTVPIAKQMFILMKSSLGLLLSWMVPLVLSLKSHHQTQGHLAFFRVIFWESYSFLFCMSVCVFLFILVKLNCWVKMKWCIYPVKTSVLLSVMRW